MKFVSTAIIGAGQCGLAMSRELTLRGIDNLVFERGKIGQSWRSERWDSLRMLTPNWANGWTGASYTGNDLDGFMTPSEFVSQLETLAGAMTTQLLPNVRVKKVLSENGQFSVESEIGTVRAATVVLATGAAARAVVPAVAQDVPKHIVQLTPNIYRCPADVPGGRVLVVGASASGVQIARELCLAGRDVTIAVGNHVRLPRRYRGYDIERWLDVTGTLDQLKSEVFDVNYASKMTSPQLMGDIDSVDLNALQSLGVSVVGRLAAIRGDEALFSGGLAHLTASADLKMNRFLDFVDDWIAQGGMRAKPPDRPGPTVIPPETPLSIPLAKNNYSTIVWATGFKPDFSYLDGRAFDRRGRLVHDGGVCQLPGLYVLGLPFLRTRRSHQISGAGPDAAVLAAHLASHLRSQSAA